MGKRFPELVAWKQGFGYYVMDIDTGKKRFQLENPGVPDLSGKGTADDTFRVLARDDDPPTDRTLAMGAVKAITGHDIKYKPRRKPRKRR